MAHFRKIFIVVAGGNRQAERHFDETLKRKRHLNEVRSYLPEEEIKNLENIYQGAPFIVWGAVPGENNIRRWEKMAVGDIVLIYKDGYIEFVGEVAAKVRNRELARYFWEETKDQKTWELIYFIVNEEKVKVPINKINPFFGYKDNYSPRGFSMIENEKTGNFIRYYGDIYGVLKILEQGGELKKLPDQFSPNIKTYDEKITTAPTEHVEMQWRLIRLGHLAGLNVWIPRNDQNKQFDNHIFSEFVMHQFHDTMDISPTIKNIDVVWKFGLYSIKSAFEIEHSTSIYSGILRLSDLRSESPNSIFPLFIVASVERRQKVFEELKRPTFSNPFLRLNEIIKFIDYNALRDMDNENRGKETFDPEVLFKKAESIH